MLFLTESASRWLNSHCKALHFVTPSQWFSLSPCWLQDAARGEGRLGAAWPRSRSGWGMGQQGQAVLSHGPWRMEMWGWHRQAAWEWVVLAATMLTSLSFWRFQKFNTAKAWSWTCLWGWIPISQLVWVANMSLSVFLLLLTEKLLFGRYTWCSGSGQINTWQRNDA